MTEGTIMANEALQIQLHSGNNNMDWISCSVEHGSPWQICQLLMKSSNKNWGQVQQTSASNH
jgi:hypothetical protein